MNSFYSIEELSNIGFATFGKDVLISRHAAIYRPEKISLGHHVRIDDFTILSGGIGIEVGNYVHLSAYSAVYGGAGVVFEDYTGLSPRSTVFSVSDDFSGKSLVHPFFPKELKPLYLKGQVVLKKFSQVGVNSTLMPSVVLGVGTAVGAYSLVKDSCEAWGIYAGIPAHRVRERSKELITLALRHQDLEP